ncbi:MAG: arylesterase [Pseudomonadales bacterium]|nr:arylesterase [Pseudomonadales bacterium]
MRAAGLCLLACLLLLAPGCGNETRLPPLQPGAVVLAFGDSITAGLGAGPGEDFPARLAAATGWQVVNAGVSGDTAREARERLAPLLAKWQPDLVIVELGGNDFLRQTPAARVGGYLREIVREAQAAGASVALVAVPRLSLLRASVGALSDSPIYAEIAAEEGVILIPDVLADILSDAGLRADEIHPNAAGYRQLAAGIREALAARGLLGD